MDKSPIIAFFATVSDTSVGAVGRVDVVDGDIDGARERAVEMIMEWERAYGYGASYPASLCVPTPHTEADAAELDAIASAYADEPHHTKAMRRRQRAAGRAARAAVEARYA